LGKAADLAVRANDAGVRMVLFSMPPGDWAAGDRGLLTDPRRRDEFRRGLDTALDYAVALRCPTVHAVVGNLPPGIEHAQARDTVVGNLRVGGPVAAEAGVTLTIEPLNASDYPQFFLRRAADAISILRDVALPNVKFQFDCYHQQMSEGNLVRSFQALLPDIGHVQIADAPGRSEPGTGEINYPFVLQAIAASGYDGFVGLEYRPTGSTEASLSWLPK